MTYNVFSGTLNPTQSINSPRISLSTSPERETSWEQVAEVYCFRFSDFPHTMDWTGSKCRRFITGRMTFLTAKQHRQSTLGNTNQRPKPKASRPRSFFIHYRTLDGRIVAAISLTPVSTLSTVQPCYKRTRPLPYSTLSNGAKANPILAKPGGYR